MLRSLVLVLALAPLTVAAQDLRYSQALQAFKSGNVEQAAPLFFAVAEEATDPQVKGLAEDFLAQSLVKLKLPVSALITYAAIVKAGPSHPAYLHGVEGVVDLQQQLDEQNLVPNLLAQAFTDEVRQRWMKLPPEALSRVHYLVATIRHRQGRFDEARALLESIPPSSRVHAKARYLLGVALADPRFPGRPGEAEALDAAAVAAFHAVVNQHDERHLELEQTRELALLGLGRLHYGRGEYVKSSAAYERVPRYGRFWDQALFENGFPRFQNEDFGGALGSLQSLHAPQFEGAFQPESWILKATVYYYTCLFDEVRTTLGAFDSIYGPMAGQLKPFAAEDTDPIAAFNLISVENRKLPRPVYLWIRNNERIRGVISLLERIDEEKRALNESPWRGQRFATETAAALEENRTTLLQVGGTIAKARLQEAAQNIRTFADQAEIIRVQTALDEKDLFMAGVDQQKVLASQSLYRPAMPAEDWNYWKFEGEFWIDEIGYYQYTLKRGCPARAQEE